MPKLKIESVLGGIGPTKYFQGEGQYQSAIAIDPDMAINKSDASGMLVPVAMEKFSSTEVTGIPMWIVSPAIPNFTNIYALLRVTDTTHKLVRYTNNNGSSPSVIADTTDLSAGSGNGLVYYNNYLYIFGNTDIDRYGPLNGTPTITKSWWVGTLSKQQLSNITLPTVYGTTFIPNHMGYVLSDNKLYFCDYAGGKGVIHFIKTKSSTTDTFKGEWSASVAYILNDIVYSTLYGKYYKCIQAGTNHAVTDTGYWSVYDTGSTDDGSTYNALDLPYGYVPTTLSEWEDNLVIGANLTTNYNAAQGQSTLFLWDTISDSFYRQIRTSNPFISAMKNVNGSLYLFTGATSNGMCLEQYLGGMTTGTILSLASSWLPSQGAVDTAFGKLYWGTRTSNPDYAACVFSYGTRDGRLEKTLTNISRATCIATAFDGSITAFSIVGGSLMYPIYFAGWWTKLAVDPYTASYGIDKKSSTYQTHVWRSAMFRMEKPIHITSVEIPLGQTLGANMTITPKIYSDDESTSNTLTTINSTNFTGRRVKIFPDGARANNNFFLELTWSGTALCPVLLPIVIEFDYKDL